MLNLLKQACKEYAIAVFNGQCLDAFELKIERCVNLLITPFTEPIAILELEAIRTPGLVIITLEGGVSIHVEV